MRPTVESSQPDYSDGCMIALYPPEDLAAALAIPGGLEPSDLHLTVAYIGTAADVDPNLMLAATKAVADRPPIEATISGHARFTGGDKDVIVALIDSPALEDLRRDVRSRLSDHGISIPREHGYTAHVTLQYLKPDDDAPFDRLPAVPVTFQSVSSVHGMDRTDLPFFAGDAETAAHPIVPYARTAYAQGWAASGGPMTERVKAGCVAAIDYAVEHADESDVLEVTLKLGSLEGAWALVYQRREQLIADHIAEITKIWRAITGRLDVDTMVIAVRSHAGLTEVDTAKVDLRARVTAEAQRFLLGVYLDTDYRALQSAIGDALRAGTAEGRAAALAVAAEQQPHESRFGTIGFDFDLAFDHAYAALDRQDWAGLAWIERIIKGNAADIGHALADLVAENAPYKDMVDAVRELTGSSSIRAVSMFVDQAMSTALNQGAVDLYKSEGVGQYDVLTAGDARVCKRCEDDEANNPYPVSQPPPVPEHPMCRCAVAAVQPVPSTAFAPYLPQEG